MKHLAFLIACIVFMIVVATPVSAEIKSCTGIASCIMNQTVNLTANMTAGPQGVPGETPDTDQFPFLNGTRALTGIWDIGGYNVSNVGGPVAGSDAATKAYADSVGINESYAYLPGREGGQTLTGGTSSGNLVLNGSLANGDIILQPHSGYVGINMENPSAPVHIQAEGSSSVTEMLMDFYSTSGSVSSLFAFRRSGGTSSLPTALPANRRMGGIQWQGYNGSLWSQGALISVFSENAWSAISKPAYFSVYTVSNGAIGSTEKLRLTANGSLLIGTTTTNLTNNGIDIVGGGRIRGCTGTLSADALGDITCASDNKLKKNIEPYTVDSGKLSQVNPKKYQWNEESGYDTSRVYTGFSAQEIQAIYPECVIPRDDVIYVTEEIPGGPGEESTYETREVKTGTQTLNIDDRCLIAVLFNAVKEQQKDIKDLKEKNR